MSCGGADTPTIVDDTRTASSLLVCCTPRAGSTLSDDDAGELERLFKLIADRSRLRILNMLMQAEGDAVCVCEFTEMLNVSQPTVSHHLKQLTTGGLLERERRGSFVYFSLREGALDRLAALLSQPAAVS